MAAIRSRDTKPEVALRAALRERGVLGYRCHPKGLPGKPDVAFTRWRVAIFVDGAFWHGHPDHFQFGKLGDYWDQKVKRTQQRDQIQEAALVEAGWLVLRFWDFEVNDDPDLCAGRVEAVLDRLRERSRVRPGLTARPSDVNRATSAAHGGEPHTGPSASS